MSTFYYLVCKKCKEYVLFVGRFHYENWQWSKDKDLIPIFIGRHADHIDSLEIVDEDEFLSNYQDYANFYELIVSRAIPSYRSIEEIVKERMKK